MKTSSILNTHALVLLVAMTFMACNSADNESTAHAPSEEGAAAEQEATPEEIVAEIALSFVKADNASAAGLETRWNLSCDDGKEAFSLADFQEVLVLLPPESSEVHAPQQKDFSLQSVTLDPQQSTAEVVVDRPPAENQEKQSLHITLHQKEGHWCVDNDWMKAFDNDIEAWRLRIDSDFLMKHTYFLLYLSQYDIERAQEELEKMEILVQKSSRSRRDKYSNITRENREELRKFRKDWIAGKWFIGDSQPDPITGKHDTSSLLMSSKMNPDDTVALLSLRCSSNQIDIIIASTDILEYNYHNDKVQTDLRFGEDAPESLRASVSTNSRGFFFPNPRLWAQRLKSNSDRQLLIRLPYRFKANAVVAFDLAGAEQAVDRVLEACGTPK